MFFLIVNFDRTKVRQVFELSNLLREFFLFIFPTFGPEHCTMLFRGRLVVHNLYFCVLFQLLAEHGKHLLFVARENSFLACFWQTFIYVVGEDTMPLERLKYMLQVGGKEIRCFSKHGTFAHITNRCGTSAAQLACDSGVERHFAVQFLNPIYGIFVPCFGAAGCGCAFHCVNDF
jgi:hypothetical protein